MSICERIQSLCNEHNITIYRLEKDCGFGNGSVMKWNTSSPKVENIVKVADYFGVSVDYLLGRSVSSDIIERPDYSISNDFAVNYEDIIKERAFNDLAKLYKAVDNSMRAQMLVVIATYLNRSGIDTESIVGY